MRTLGLVMGATGSLPTNVVTSRSGGGQQRGKVAQALGIQISVPACKEPLHGSTMQATAKAAAAIRMKIHWWRLLLLLVTVAVVEAVAVAVVEVVVEAMLEANLEAVVEAMLEAVVEAMLEAVVEAMLEAVVVATVWSWQILSPSRKWKMRLLTPVFTPNTATK